MDTGSQNILPPYFFFLTPAKRLPCSSARWRRASCVVCCIMFQTPEFNLFLSLILISCCELPKSWGRTSCWATASNWTHTSKTCRHRRGLDVRRGNVLKGPRPMSPGDADGTIHKYGIAANESSASLVSVIYPSQGPQKIPIEFPKLTPTISTNIRMGRSLPWHASRVTSSGAKTPDLKSHVIIFLHLSDVCMTPRGRS